MVKLVMPTTREVAIGVAETLVLELRAKGIECRELIVDYLDAMAQPARIALHFR